MKKIFASVLVLIVIISSFSGCGASSNNLTTQVMPSASAASSTAPVQAADEFGRDSAKFESENFAVAGDVPQPDATDMVADGKMVQPIAPPAGGGVAGPTVTPVIDSRKIIKNMDLQLQTLTFDSGVESIAKMATDFGGYVENSYVQGRELYNERGTRNANFTLRIPVEKLDSFIGSIGGQFHIISKSQNSQDITDTFYDSKARLDALKVQEQRLLTMLQSAAELEYLLQVEKELMNVRYEIESLTSSLTRMDSQVSMSTVTIYLMEVVKYEDVKDVPINFAERISLAFGESWKNFRDFSQDFAVVIVATLPFLLVLAVLILIVVAIVRGNAKKHRKRIEAMQLAHAPTPPHPIPQTETKDENPEKK